MRIPILILICAWHPIFANSNSYESDKKEPLNQQTKGDLSEENKLTIKERFILGSKGLGLGIISTCSLLAVPYHIMPTAIRRHYTYQATLANENFTEEMKTNPITKDDCEKFIRECEEYDACERLYFLPLGIAVSLIILYTNYAGQMPQKAYNYLKKAVESSI